MKCKCRLLAALEVQMQRECKLLAAFEVQVQKIHLHLKCRCKKCAEFEGVLECFQVFRGVLRAGLSKVE